MKVVIPLFVCALAAGCQPRDEPAVPVGVEPGQAPAEAEPPTPVEEPEATEGARRERAAASLEPVEGSEVRGTIAFTEMREGTRMITSFTGLGQGEYVLRVHEGSTCEEPGEAIRTVGDVPVTVDVQGISRETMIRQGLDLAQSLENHAIALHEAQAGVVACGVIVPTREGT